MATMLSPIGSYFNESNRSSYIGTSYLLSVCCFTPLYGKLYSFFLRFFKSRFFSGRLSDILGRKGAMLLGLTLFGKPRIPMIRSQSFRAETDKSL